MKHHFWDEDAYRASVVHRLDARSKMLALPGLLLVSVSTPASGWGVFAVLAAALAVVALLSRVPLGHLLRRCLVVVPFLLVVVAFAPFLPADRAAGGYSLGLAGAAGPASPALVVWNVLAKGLLSVFAVVLLTSTTPFPQLLEGLRRLKAPHVFVLLLGFTYRYLFVLSDELMRMLRAREARGFSPRWLWHARSLGHLIGSTFIRTYERAERVHAAMAARGYEGRALNIPASPLRPADALFLAGLLVPALLARVFLA